MSHSCGIRATAKLVFGSFLFLFLASFLALPCMQADGGLFVSLSSIPAAAWEGARPASAAKAFSSASLQKPFSGGVNLAPRMTTPMSVASPAVSLRFASSQPGTFPLAVSSQTMAARPTLRHVRSIASCVEHQLFKPRMNILKAFDSPPVDQALRSLSLLAIMIGFVVGMLALLRPRIRIRPGWRRIRSLPFASTRAPRLSYLAAQRDA